MVRARQGTVSSVAKMTLLREISSFWITAVLVVLILGHLKGQTPQPSASPEPLTSPASPTPEGSPEPTPTPLPAPLNYHRWGSISLFNGLPSDAVRAIAQTPDGVMWFGTDNGLARFDGRRIQKYPLGSKESDQILALAVAPSGELWIGTKAGAFEYGSEGYRKVDGTETVAVTSLIVDEEVILGTELGTVLNVVRVADGSLTTNAVLASPITDPEDRPLAITGLLRHQGRLLASTAGRGVFELTNGSAIQLSSSPRPIYVNALNTDQIGSLLMGSDTGSSQSGLYRFASGSLRGDRVAGPTSDVLAIETNEAGVWIGTERRGLFHLTGDGNIENYTFNNTSGGLRSDFIFTLFTDREGVVWIGTNRGISRFDRLGPLQETVSESPNSNFIRTLFRTESGTYLAGSNRGLFESVLEKGWVNVRPFERDVIYSIAAPNPTTILVGSARGTFDLSGRRLLETESRSIEIFQGRTYVVALGLGLVEITDESRGQTRLVYSEPTANALAATAQKLWIGTLENGLFSFDGRSVEREPGAENIDIGAIWRIFPDSGGSLWIASEKGVFRRTGEAVSKIIEVEDARDVYASSDTEAWAATTTRGLVHARQDETFGWIVSSLGWEQGLPSEKTFSILPADGILHIGTNRGIVIYRPGTVAPKLIATRVLSQRLHDPSELRSTLELDYPQNSLVLEVAGQSSRTAPQGFQYGFVLKDDGGNIVSKSLSYDPQYSPSDLQPGQYTIDVIAFDRDLLASEPLSISFRLARAPFPWTATALGVLLTVAVIALIWAIVERRRIVLRNRELKQARLDLANEAERERGRIARDLHDQTLADLRNLMLKSDRIGIPDPTFRDEIEAVSKEVRRICEDLSPSVLENVGLIPSLEFLLSHSVEAYRFDSSNASEDAITFPTTAQLQVYRITQEALSNIQKHSNAAMVEMRIATPQSGSFELVVTDDGLPFSPSSEEKLGGRGINGIRSRAFLIDAKVEWRPVADGNEFHLTLDSGTSP